jgi:hypothetical protein
MILAGDKLLLAGDAKLLSQLPAGNWIGGSTPYFILYPDNRTTSFEKIFVNQLPEFVTDVEIKEYDMTNIQNIFNDGPDNGFTVLIVPFSSPVLAEYSLNVNSYKNFAAHPVCGWVAGQPLDVLLTEKSYSAWGVGPSISHENAIAMHVSLPENKYAEVHIFHPFKQGDGDSIHFEDDKMMVSDAIVNGNKRNFAAYLREIGRNDVMIPLVANYSGAMLLASFLDIGETEVPIAAPVFRNLEYKLAMIDENITEPLLMGEKIVYSATCLYNFIQPDICAQYLKKMNGPAGFGEIAYQHVNQTTVYITVDDVPHNSELI